MAHVHLMLMALSMTPIHGLAVSSRQALSTPSWTKVGCYTDTIGKRALTHRYNIPSLTIEACTATCAANGYSLAGVEYANECYCGNAISNGQGLAPDGDTWCNMPCQGDQSETCGGSLRLDVYTLSNAWAPLGCFSDSPWARVLAVGGVYDGSLTVEKCQSTCSASGYQYAGLEWSLQCFCGNTLDNLGGPALDGGAGCNMTCSGNNAEICGGSNRLSMYEFIAGDDGSAPQSSTSSSTSTTVTPSTSAPIISDSGSSSTILPGSSTSIIDANPSSSSTSSTAVAPTVLTSSITSPSLSAANPTATTTSSTTGASFAPATTTVLTGHPIDTTSPMPANLPAGWEYQGCFIDSASARVLPAQEPDSTSLTVEGCISICVDGGYSIAGVEYATQCFCGNAMSSATQVSLGLSVARCHSPCSGNSSESCGGQNKIEIYSLGDAVVQQGASS